MRAHRPLRRALGVILRIAALLALTIAAPAQARAHAHGAVAGHDHLHVDHAGIDGHSGHGTEQGATHVSDAASAASEPVGGDAHPGQCCGLHCHCSISAVGVADVTVPLRWNTEAAFRRPRDAAFASVVPEALPEPPRSVA